MLQKLVTHKLEKTNRNSIINLSNTDWLQSEKEISERNWQPKN